MPNFALLKPILRETITLDLRRALMEKCEKLPYIEQCGKRLMDKFQTALKLIIKILTAPTTDWITWNFLRIKKTFVMLLIFIEKFLRLANQKDELDRTEENTLSTLNNFLDKRNIVAVLP